MARGKKWRRARSEQYAENTRRSMAFQGRGRPGSHNRRDTISREAESRKRKERSRKN